MTITVYPTPPVGIASPLTPSGTGVQTGLDPATLDKLGVSPDTAQAVHIVGNPGGDFAGVNPLELALDPATGVTMQVAFPGATAVGGLPVVLGGGVAGQGAAAALSGAWPMEITDGTHGPAAVKAASTAPVAADPSLVVAINPIAPLPPGTNTIGVVNQGAGLAGNTNAPWAISPAVAVPTSSTITPNSSLNSVLVGPNTSSAYPWGIFGVNAAGTAQGGQVVFEVTLDSGTNWIPIQVTPLAGGAPVTSYSPGNGNALFFAPVAGCNQTRMRLAQTPAAGSFNMVVGFSASAPPAAAPPATSLPPNAAQENNGQLVQVLEFLKYILVELKLANYQMLVASGLQDEQDMFRSEPSTSFNS